MVAAFLSHWTSVPGQRVDKLSLTVLLLCAFLLGPVVALLVTAFGDSDGLWPHLVETVLGRYVLNTVLLMIGVGILAIGFGVSTAWVVTRYEFFGRRYLEWMLLLPAAIPAYIIAYTYTDFFEYAGTLQSGLRDIFDWQ